MFHHHGKRRTDKHNLQIASVLSFVAGIVNVAGFLAVAQLTTNVTGHFAFFVDEVFRLNFLKSLVFLSYILCFFFGSFTSGYLVEKILRKNMQYVYVIPAAMECIILVISAILGDYFIQENPGILACILLYAMGLQNSLVTLISNSRVRTTHLTGLFTDLGIELSQLFFYKEPESRKKLYTSIKLRSRIILFFFLGGVTGGIFYSSIGLNVLIIASAALITGMAFDVIKINILQLQRKFRNQG